MCGISGIFSLSFSGPVPLQAVFRMHQALSHRGPDGEGMVVFPCDGGAPVVTFENLKQLASQNYSCWAALSHRRLAILDLSNAGSQPMSSHTGRWWVTFNGEIYNFIELRKELPLPVKALKSNSDTEVLLELWEAKEEKCLSRLNGMWAFAMLSPERRELILCRDRFGVKPLYYAIVGDWLLFASEIKAIFASGLVGKKFVREAIEHYLAYGVYLVQGTNTFYEGIYKVPPSTLVRWSQGVKKQFVYYSLPVKSPVHKEQVLEEGRAIFEDAVRIRLRSDVPVATCLSGGIDSTNVVAFASRLLRQEGANGRLRTYTIDVGERYENEVDFACEVAQMNNCDWHTLPLEQSLSTEDVVDFIFTNEEPQEFLGAIVQYLLYRRIADDHIKVVLDGQGGDEAFAGYTWFYYVIALEALRQGRFFKVLPWLYGILRNGNNSLSNIWRQGKLYAEPSQWTSDSVLPLLRRKISPPESNATLQASAGCKTWRERQAVAYYKLELHTLLRDADRNGMRRGIEARFPFLDYRLVELTHNADPFDLTFRGWSKYVSRSFASDDMIPRRVRWSKHKKGFYIDLDGLFPQMRGLTVNLISIAEQSAEIVDWQVVREKMQTGSLPLWRFFNILVLDVSPDLLRTGFATALPEQSFKGHCKA